MVFYRILSSYNHERVRKRVGVIIYTHPALAHGLEQCALCLWCCSIDFVCENNIGEDRTSAKVKGLARLVKYGYSKNIRGEQVAGELDPAEGAIECLGQGARQRRLAYAGDIFDEQVPLGEQGHQRQFHGAGLAAHHSLDGLLEFAQPGFLFDRFRHGAPFRRDASGCFVAGS